MFYVEWWDGSNWNLSRVPWFIVLISFLSHDLALKKTEKNLGEYDYFLVPKKDIIFVNKE